jgi:hypothetical protein
VDHLNTLFPIPAAIRHQTKWNERDLQSPQIHRDPGLSFHPLNWSPPKNQAPVPSCWGSCVPSYLFFILGGCSSHLLSFCWSLDGVQHSSGQHRRVTDTMTSISFATCSSKAVLPSIRAVVHVTPTVLLSIWVVVAVIWVVVSAIWIAVPSIQAVVSVTWAVPWSIREVLSLIWAIAPLNWAALPSIRAVVSASRTAALSIRVIVSVCHESSFHFTSRTRTTRSLIRSTIWSIEPEYHFRIPNGFNWFPDLRVPDRPSTFIYPFIYFALILSVAVGHCTLILWIGRGTRA